MKNTGQIINLSATIPLKLAGRRLDQALAELFAEFSRARLQAWVRDQLVLIDGKPKKPRDRVHGGETITIAATIVNQTSWQPQPLELNVVYEDGAFLIVNKPIGLVVHPAHGNPDSTLVNALLNRIPDLAALPRAGIVHRLDKNTSGLLVVAKTLSAHTDLVRQLQARTIKREYAAIVSGTLVSGGTIDAPIGRNPHERKTMAVVTSGRPAVTHYRVVERFRAHSWVKVNLETGRTHQIRVHMAYIQHPIVGDKSYGGRLRIPKGAIPELSELLRHFNHQALHAQKLGFIHPINQQYMEWEAPLLPDMQQLIELLRKDRDIKC